MRYIRLRHNRSLLHVWYFRMKVGTHGVSMRNELRTATFQRSRKVDDMMALISSYREVAKLWHLAGTYQINNRLD